MLTRLSAHGRLFALWRRSSDWSVVGGRGAAGKRCRCNKGQLRGRPVSRILSRGLPPLDGHSSWHRVTPAPLAANPDLLGPKQPCGLRHTRSLFGIAPGGACRAGPVARPAVVSYSTVSPLPLCDVGCPIRIKAVCSLWRFPWGCPRRALPGTVSLWSPDFPRTRSCPRPRGHPAFRAGAA